ncbi:MAG: DUF1573 domain-containing protein [Prevotella sp.]
MNIKILMTVLLAAFTSEISAQRISTEHEIIDCGYIKYGHPFTARFELRNKGNDLIIDTVRTSCGCTTASYPKGIISKGDRFDVNITYDALQLGHFNKEVAIFSNASNVPFFLRIKGVVVEGSEDILTDYKYKIGDLLTDKNDIEFDDVNKGETPIQKIRVKNNSGKDIMPSVMHLPPYLSATISPTTIRPGRSGEITLKLNSSKLRNYGLNQSSLYLGMFPGDKVNAEKEITVSSVLLPSFRNLSETQKANSPAISISTETLELGAFGDNNEKSGTITIENIGKKMLDINSLQMFTTGLKVRLNKTRLQPGESAKMKITAYKKQLKHARSKPRVLMITNDPNKPKVVININIKD